MYTCVCVYIYVCVCVCVCMYRYGSLLFKHTSLVSSVAAAGRCRMVNVSENVSLFVCVVTVTTM